MRISAHLQSLHILAPHPWPHGISCPFEASLAQKQKSQG